MVAASGASAAFIAQGTYRLHNHPDGSAQPPQYGMRLDELFNITGDHDIFTFNFDDPSSDMKMTYDGTTIHIFGVARGGRDIGSGYASEPTTGLYTINFIYNLGVAPVPGDDDVWVNGPNMANSGTIQPPVGPAVNLVDKRDTAYSFRLGDEDNDAGHRGFAGISGWGWLVHHPETMGHVEASDFLFTAEYLPNIPSPGAAGLLGVAVLTLRRRR
ncbi:MAG: hypothetical protein JNK58_01185 [Phycisphaerae bacterium]|nr:hypothetical protein [Phycisphaerae bacterium]